MSRNGPVKRLPRVPNPVIPAADATARHRRDRDLQCHHAPLPVRTAADPGRFAALSALILWPFFVA